MTEEPDDTRRFLLFTGGTVALVVAVYLFIGLLFQAVGR